MLPNSLIDRLRAARAVPIARSRSVEHAATAVAWLHEAGIATFEITQTIPGAIGLIRSLAKDPGLLIGAGTVPDSETARVCLQAGARFIVAPWIDPSLAEPCREWGAPLMLGAQGFANSG